MPIDLRSDTVTKPTTVMREAMARAEVGDDVLGDDPTVRRLEEMVADRLGKQAALFMPSGTMSNQVAIAVHTRPGDEMICEAGSHTYCYEVGGPAALSGVLTQLIAGEHGVLVAERIVSNIHAGTDIHQAPTTLIVLENTHNRAGGRIFPIETMRGVKTLADERGIKVHLDGARLINAEVASGVPARDYAACADTVSLCLSKGLGAPVGSLLIGDAESIVRARRIRKRLGGGMRQVGILAAAGIYALENNVDRLADDHANARRLAEGLSELPGITVDPADVETNICFFGVDHPRFTAPELADALTERGVLTIALNPGDIRAVTHLDVTAEEIEQALGIIRELLAG